MLFQFQALGSRRSQREFDRVDLHRPAAEQGGQLPPLHALGVAVQVEIESKIEAELKAICNVLFQALSCRRFQRGFDRVNLHRPTLAAITTCPCSRTGGPGHV
jgi:hypothetical protein